VIVAVLAPPFDRFASSSALGNLVDVTSPTRGAPSFILVRHGESEWNAERRIQGQNDTARLTELGRAQARDVAESLVGLGFERLMASDLRRAYETASIIGVTLGLEPEPDPVLRERCFGELEGCPGDVLTREMTGHAQGVVFDGDARPPGGESLRDVVARASEFLARARTQCSDERVLVVSHGGMVNALRLFNSGEPLEGQPWYRVGNCEVWNLVGPVELSSDDVA
jgi:probable phosphoglycerate mutase